MEGGGGGGGRRSEDTAPRAPRCFAAEAFNRSRSLNGGIKQNSYEGLIDFVLMNAKPGSQIGRVGRGGVGEEEEEGERVSE